MSINLRSIASSSSSLDTRRMNSHEMSPSLLSSNFAIPVLSTIMCSTMVSDDSIRSKTILPLATTAVHTSTRESVSALLRSTVAVPVLSTACGIMFSDDSIRRRAALSLNTTEHASPSINAPAIFRATCALSFSAKLLAYIHCSRLGWLPKYLGLLLQDAVKFHFFQLFNRFYTIEPLHPEIPSILMELLLQLKKHPFHEINKQYFDKAQNLLSDRISPDVFKNLKIKENLDSLSYLSSCGEMPPTIRVIDLAMPSTIHIREEEIRSQVQEAQLMNLMHSIDFFYCGNASEVIEDMFEKGESAPLLNLEDYPKDAIKAIAPVINMINEEIKRTNEKAKGRGLSRRLFIQHLKSLVNERNRLNPKTIQYLIAQIQILFNHSMSDYVQHHYFLTEIDKKLQINYLILNIGMEADNKKNKSNARKLSAYATSIMNLWDLHRKIVLTIEDTNKDLEFNNLYKYFLTSYQTSLDPNISSESNIEDFWLQFHDHPVLSRTQKGKKPTREPLESKEEATASVTRTSTEDPSITALEADDSDIDEKESKVEESPIIVRSSTKENCSQWLDPLCRTLATSPSSMSKTSSIAQKNASYHLRILSLRLDLLHSCIFANKQDLFPAIGWGMIRNCANILEQTLVSDILKANPDQEITEHSHIIIVRQLSATSTYSATIQRELQQVAKFIDGGVISSRYPHGMRKFCRLQNISAPGHLNLLTNPWNVSNIHLVVNQMIGPLLRVLESRSDVKISESILKGLLERSSSSHETPPTAHPLSTGLAKRLNPLITKRLKKLLSLSQAHAQTCEKSSVPFQQKLSATWLDICYHLSGLQQQLRAWIAFPQSKYLIVHGDMILTHLQILDELMETALHAHLKKQELHMHDLEAFRQLRGHQEEPALAKIVQGLNVTIREHYPYGVKNCSLFAVQWRLNTLQASMHDPEDIDADLVLSKGKVVKIAQLQQQLLENIEGVITMTEARMKEFV